MSDVTVTEQVIDVTVLPGPVIEIDISPTPITVEVTPPPPVQVDVTPPPAVDVDVTTPTPVIVEIGAGGVVGNVAFLDQANTFTEENRFIDQILAPELEARARFSRR